MIAEQADRGIARMAVAEGAGRRREGHRGQCDPCPVRGDPDVVERHRTREVRGGEERERDRRPPRRERAPDRSGPPQRGHPEPEQHDHRREEHRRHRLLDLVAERGGLVGVDEEVLTGVRVTRPIVDRDRTTAHGRGRVDPEEVEHRRRHVHQLHEPGALGRARAEQTGGHPGARTATAASRPSAGSGAVPTTTTAS